MKNVGIITIYDLNNYGNRLQNFAVHHVIKRMGFQVRSFAFCKECKLTCQPTNKKEEIAIELHRLTHYKHYNNPAHLAVYHREKAFRSFVEKYTPTEMVVNPNRLNDKADFFITGSDQVWNPTWYKDDDKDFYLLTFAKPKQKVCFSPSFGISELPVEWKPWFKKQLNTFPLLNVREQAGADIIKNMIGRDAQVTIDPTLMLDADVWLKIAKKPYGINTRKPFILTYFLGVRTERAENDIKEILNSRDMNVYHLLDISQPFVYSCGPREFLYLFSKAEIILTDSFHACVFSFLFNKPFSVYDREEKGMPKMNSRLDSLLSMLKLERKYRNRNIKNDWFECHYSEGWNVLSYERAKMQAYLKKSLNCSDKQ